MEARNNVLLAHARESLARDIRGAWESIATVAMMSMKLPDGTLYLGRDLPAPPGEPLFPPDLDPLDDGPLCELLRRYDALADGDRPPRSAGPLGDLERAARELYARLPFGRPRTEYAHDAALDWAALDQRMKYIAELFRSRQQDHALFTAPFTSEQTAALLAGATPTGPLY